MLSTEVMVNVTQTLPTVGTEINKELVFPVRFFKNSSNPLIQEEYIDMGLITSPDVAHRYNLQIHNKYGKPIVVTRVAIDKKEINMNLQVATVFGYRVALPVNPQPFTLLSLYVTGDSKAEQGAVSGSVHIYLNINGIKEKVVIPFHCTYFRHIFGDEEKFSFQLNKTKKEGKVMNKFTAALTNNFNSELVVRSASFNDIEHNEDTIEFVSLVNNIRLEVGAPVPAFSANFRFVELYFDNLFTNGHELVTIYALNSFSTVLLKYYALSLMCGYHATYTSQYEKCKPVEKIDFSFIAINNRKVVTIDIYNPTMVSFIIKRVEFSDNRGNIEVSFENQSKWGMKSNFRKTNKSINTFVLIPKGDIISMRIKVKPKEAGNYREMISLITNHGEYSFAISYKGIQGEILFTPSTLRYDLFYPIEGDEKSVVAKNKFNMDVEVHSAWSPQPYIFTHLKTQYLKQNSKENFLGVILDLTDDDLIDPERSGFLSTLHDQYVAVSDLVAYEDQQRGWEKILKEAKTEINGEVIVQTDCLDNLKINVKGHLRKALFVPEEKLTFGPLEEKRSHIVNITLTNPTQRDVSMRFYLADSRMLELKSIHKKIVSGLTKKYAKYREEHICISHPSLEEDQLRFYAEAFFDKVAFKSDLGKNTTRRKVCFVVNHPRPSHSKFFSYKGNYLFNITRHSRTQMIKDNLNIYLLKDVIRLSNRKPPPNAQSLYGLSLYQKLKLMAAKGIRILHRTLHKKQLYQNTADVKYVSSMKSPVLNGIFKKQEFFIRRKYRNKEVSIPAGKTVTLPLLVCYPREVPEGQMNLLIKNDYSKLIILPISAQLGKVSLVVHKRIYLNEGGATTSIVQKKEEYSKMIYNIHSADLIQKIGRESKKYVFKQNVKRIFELKNIGNLPIKVTSISVENQGCSFNGFEITNCNGFELMPGQVHKLEVKLLHTYNFQAELKKEVYFLMDNRVLVFEFEVTSNDPLMPELASFGFVTSITQVFRLVAFIFFCILVLVLLRHYHEKPSEMSYFLTDLDKSRFGSSHFYNNIGDLKILEENIKFQKYEHQKNRQLRNFGLKELIHNANVASSRDTSMNAIGSDTESLPIDTRKLIIKEEPPIEREVYEEKERREPIKQNPKKKKGRKQGQNHPPSDFKRDQATRDHEEMSPMGNILENIETEKPTIYQTYDPIDNERERTSLKRSPSKKEHPSSVLNKSGDNNKRLYQEDLDKMAQNNDNKSEIDKARDEPSNLNISKGSKYSKKSVKEPSERQSVNQSATSKQNAPPKEADTNPEDSFVKKSEKSSQHKSMVEKSFDREEAKAYPKNTSRVSLRKESSSFHAVDKKEDEPAVEPYDYNPKDHSKSKDYNSTDNHQSRDRGNSGSRRTPQMSDSKRKDAYPASRQEQTVKTGRNKKREQVYYQKVEKQEEEFPSLKVYSPKATTDYYPKVKPDEEIYTIKKKEPIEIDYQSPSSKHFDDQEPPKKAPKTIERPTYHPRGEHNRSFSQDVREENREDHMAPHNLSGFDNNISQIQKIDEPDHDLSGIGILKDTAEYRGKPQAPIEASPGESESDQSVEDVEKSHEKIRKLMEDTEEVKLDSISPPDHYKEGKRVIGVIGEKAAKKSSHSHRGPLSAHGSSFLGFRNSSNATNQIGGYKTYNQFSSKEAEIRGNPFQRPLVDYGQQYQPEPAPMEYGFSAPYQQIPMPSGTTSVLTAQPMRAMFGGDRMARTPMQITVHSNQYGSFVSKDQIYNMQPNLYGQRADRQYYQNTNYGMPQMPGFYGDQAGFESEEDNYSRDYGYDYQQNNYEQDEGDYYQDQNPNMYHPNDTSFGQQPFKAAIPNNPFMLSRLASNQRDGGGMHYGGAVPGKGYDVETGENEYEPSKYSNSSFSMAKGGMKPPPGLSSEYDEAIVYRKGYQGEKPNQESSHNSEARNSRDDSRRFGKKSD